MDKERQVMGRPEVVKNIRFKLSLSQEGLARELHIGFTSAN